jgi:hypothetical protein
VNADTFSNKNILKLALRLVLGLVALILLIEAVLWVVFRAPTQHDRIIHLSNKIPGLKEKVTFASNGDQFLRSINWSPGPRESGTVRILCVGGEATFGQLQNAQDTWWGQLGVLLQEKLPSVKVEIGANAAGSFMSLIGAKWVSTYAKDFQPDVIITNFGAADVFSQPEHGYKYDPDAVEHINFFKRKRGAIKEALLKFSQLARWKYASNMKAEAQILQGDRAEPEHFAEYYKGIHEKLAKMMPVANPFRLMEADPRDEYRDALKLINETAKTVDAKVIITTEVSLCRQLMTEEAEAICSTFTPMAPGENRVVKYQSSWVDREMRRFQEAAEKYATDNQLLFCNLDGLVPQDPKHFANETILTDEGAKKLAEILLPKVLPVVSAAKH